MPQETQWARSTGPNAVVAFGNLGLTITVAWVLARIDRRYQDVARQLPTVRVRLPCMCSVPGARWLSERHGADVIVVLMALLGIFPRGTGPVHRRSPDLRSPSA